MNLDVVFSLGAERDFDDLFYWIAERAGPAVALGYTDRLRSYCQDLGLFPERARIRTELDEAVRIVCFERRTNVAYVVAEARVVIVAIHHGGRQSQA